MFPANDFYKTQYQLIRLTTGYAVRSLIIGICLGMLIERVILERKE